MNGGLQKSARELLAEALVEIQAGATAQARRICERVLASDANNIDALALLGIIAWQTGRPTESVDWTTRALQLSPHSHHIYTIRAAALLHLQRYKEAIRDCDDALDLTPGHPEALLNRAQANLGLQKYREAIAGFDAVLKIWPQSAPAHGGRSAALRLLGRVAEAETSAQTSAIQAEKQAKQNEIVAAAQMLRVRMETCNWRDFDSLTEKITAALHRESEEAPPIPPMQVLGLPVSPVGLLRCAKSCLHRYEIPITERISPKINLKRKPLRVAYVSADYRQHPCATLLVELIERHDRSVLSPLGVNIGPMDESVIGRRIRGAFDEFIDLSAIPDHEAAAKISRLDADIVVDLMGHTQLGRPRIFLHRPAPIQVAFLGYPGTSGSPEIDYLIVDPVIAGPGDQADYSEKLCRLPDCYLPTNPHLEMATMPSRIDVGLPDDVFVFASFNQSWKLTPQMFDIWMRLLHSNARSVLWLSVEGSESEANLRREALVRGVEPGRLIFAPRVESHALHLSRLRLADLFLDSTPYGAHTTACDAMLAHLPLITVPGATFASRVAASVLTALRVPELIAPSLEAYEHLALSLSKDLSELARLRSRIASGIKVEPLFDVDRYARHLEQAFSHMVASARQGRPAHSFDVASLV